MRQLTALSLLAVCLSIPVGQEQPVPDLNGTWKATFADSLFSGTVYVTLEVQPGGIVSGKYRATTGGVGTISGTLADKTFSFVMTQTVEGCPGTFSGSLIVDSERGTGTYAGTDCQGEHKNGVVSMVRATKEEIAALESPQVLPGGTFLLQGRRYWVSKNDKYLVLLSAERTKSNLVLHIGIQNDSPGYVDFDPSKIAVVDLLQKKPLRYYTPQEIAKKAHRRASWAVFLRAMAAGMESMGQSQSTSYSSGSFRAYDQYGNWVSGTYSGTTTTYVPPNNADIQQRSARDIAAIRKATEDKAAHVESTSAQAHTIAPKSYILGYVYFDKAKQKNLREVLSVNTKDFLVLVDVPIGENVFRFAFPMALLEKFAEGAAKN